MHCDLDRDRSVGQVKCNQCGEHWETKIHSLSEPIDVYRCVVGLLTNYRLCSRYTLSLCDWTGICSEWIDACEGENAPQQDNARGATNPPQQAYRDDDE